MESLNSGPATGFTGRARRSGGKERSARRPLGPRTYGSAAGGWFVLPWPSACVGRGGGRDRPEAACPPGSRAAVGEAGGFNAVQKLLTNRDSHVQGHCRAQARGRAPIVRSDRAYLECVG